MIEYLLENLILHISMYIGAVMIVAGSLINENKEKPFFWAIILASSSFILYLILMMLVINHHQNVTLN
ncbi:hypothetical protein L5F64_00235 [Aliarcobacter butzleri]|nr:hypothetical protein [Aliarcobacter butzleri]